MTLDEALKRARNGEPVPITGEHDCLEILGAIQASKLDLRGFHMECDTVNKMLWITFDENLLDDAYRKEVCR